MAAATGGEDPDLYPRPSAWPGAGRPVMRIGPLPKAAPRPAETASFAPPRSAILTGSATPMPLTATPAPGPAPEPSLANRAPLAAFITPLRTRALARRRSPWPAVAAGAVLATAAALLTLVIDSGKRAAPPVAAPPARTVVTLPTVPVQAEPPSAPAPATLAASPARPPAVRPRTRAAVPQLATVAETLEEEAPLPVPPPAAAPTATVPTPPAAFTRPSSPDPETAIATHAPE